MITWIINYREFAYILVGNGKRETWENLIKLADDIPWRRYNFIIDCIKWALDKHTKEDTWKNTEQAIEPLR